MFDETKDFVVIPCGGGNIAKAKPLFGFNSKSVICCSGQVIKVLSVATGECIHELRSHTQAVNAVIINPQNRYQILSASDDKTIIKWNYQDGVKLRTYTIDHPVMSLYAIPNQPLKLLATQQIAHNDFKLVWFTLTQKEEKGGNFTHVKCSKPIMKKISGQPNGVCLASNGAFVASVNNTVLTVYNTQTKQTKVHKYHNSCIRNKVKLVLRFTCVAGHPTADCIATGLSHGGILFWYNLFGDKPAQTHIHWHANAVRDLAFTTEGSYLLSGGSECVLVKWQTTTHDKEFIARLGSSITAVTPSHDGTLYATAQNDNSVKVFGSNMKTLQHFQGLTMAYLDQQLEALMPVGLRLDPRTKALVTNGRPGHLQFYSMQTDKQLYNLDIVGQNYVSPVDTPLVVTELENVAFDECGNWMATNERWDDGETSMEMRLKFWKYDEKTSEYKLNTLIDLPHFSKVHTLRFRPCEIENDTMMAVTTSADGKFKLWSLVDDTDIYRSNVCWNCESVGFYRDLAAGPADFSADGSLLAVGFESTLTLWDPNTNALRHSFTLDDEIKQIEFGTGTAMSHMIVVTTRQLVCWNLLTCSVSWTEPWHVSVLVKSPVTTHMAVFTTSPTTKHNQLNVFSPSNEKKVIYHKELFSSPQVIGAIFVPRKVEANYSDSEEYNFSWHNKCKLYYMTSSQELLSLAFKEEQEDTSTIPMALQENLPQTPFSLLMNQKRQQRVDIGAGGDQNAQSDSLFLKQILTTPAHVQPPMTSLCRGFVETLLSTKKTASSNAESDNDDEEEHAESGSSSESEMDTNDEDLKKLSATQEINKIDKQEVNSTLNVTSSMEQLNINLGKEYKKLTVSDKFSWMDTFL